MQFLYHNVLFLILIPTLILMYLITTNKDSFQKYFSKEIIDKLTISNKSFTKSTRNILFFFAIILMTLALARPVINEKEHSFKQEVNSIIVAIDVSKSMLATDIYPNRLQFARQKLLDIIELSQKDAIGVVLFAKYSYILSPVTQDYNSLKILVNNLNTGENFDNGSNIFSTLETTNKLLKDYENKNLILLTDGGNKQTYKDEIDYANKNNINIYTIATASNKPTPIKLNDGNFMTKKDGSIVTVNLNEEIKNLSLKTNGGYINFSNSNNDIKQILEDIEQKSQKKELESKKYKTYTELFYYPLSLAIFILLISFSSIPNFKKSTTGLILFTLVLFNQNNLKASILDFQTINEAEKHYEEKNYEKASKKFQKVANSVEAKYDLANSLYKEGKYKQALDNYKKVVTSNQNLEYKKLHNMGNTYANMGEYKNALKSYENALKINDDKQTRENYEKIKKLLENKNNKQNQQNQENQQDKENKEKKQQKKDQEKNKNNKQKNKEQKNKKNQNKDKSTKDKKENSNKSIKQEKQKEISKLEERKWLNKIQNQKTPVLLNKVPTKVQEEDSSSSPW